MRNDLPSSQDTRPWKCVELIGARIQHYDPHDFHHKRFCVHTNTIPISPLDVGGNAKPIIQPVLTNDGTVYEKPILDHYYKKHYQQYLFSQDPNLPGKEPNRPVLKPLSHILYPAADQMNICIIQSENEKQTFIVPPHLLKDANVAIFISGHTPGWMSEKNKGKLISVEYPLELNKYILLNTRYPIPDDPVLSTSSVFTHTIFAPHDQQYVRFASQSAMQSKLDPRKTFDPSHPLLGFFRIADEELSIMIMLEEQDLHFCGKISLYRLHYEPETATHSATLRIIEKRWCDEEYSALTQEKIVKDNCVSERPTEARVFCITDKAAEKLKEKIKKDQDSISSGSLRYAHRAGKIAIEAYSFVVSCFGKPIYYHNEATWCLAALHYAGIFRSENDTGFDPSYTILCQPSWKARFLGATPERVFANIQTAAEEDTGTLEQDYGC